MATTLYCSNLSYNVGDDDLLNFVARGGLAVTSASVKVNADGRSKGWGLVTCADAQTADMAIRMLNGQELDGRKVALREDRGVTNGEGGGRAEGEGRSRGRGRKAKGGAAAERQNWAADHSDIPASATLYVGNLPWSVETEDLQQLFAAKNATSADVKKGRDGRSRGYGLVTFGSEAQARAAMDLNGYEIDGRQLMVRFDRGAGAE